MKFARYLQETQTPEWKKAYIDYRDLKKRIKAISARRHSTNHVTLSLTNARFPTFDSSATSVTPSEYGPDLVENLALISDRRSSGATAIRGLARPQRQSRRASVMQRLSTRISGHVRLRSGSAKFLGLNLTPNPHSLEPHSEPPLHLLLLQLSPQQLAFFDALDAQLNKVESFFLDREKELQERTLHLQDQLNELVDHRRVFQATYSQHQAWQLPAPISSTLRSFTRKFITHCVPNDRRPKLSSTISPSEPRFKTAEVNPFEECEVKQNSDGPGTGRESLKVPEPVRHATLRDRTERPDASRIGNTTSSRSGSIYHGMVPGTDENAPSDGEAGDEEKGQARSTTMPQSRSKRALDPDEYLYAKKKLKKAVLEHYRALEVLHNYRILNVTGFRKAIKKFEKVTKIGAQRQYMAEKVDKSAFGSDKTTQSMMRQTEAIYAMVSDGGDKRRAMKRLKAGAQVKSHHYSTFRSGLLLGLAVPAVLDGLSKSFQTSTQKSIPGWDGLLFIYGVLVVPVVFILLVGLNLLVWSRSRINYAFIFELDVRTKLDYREYFEVPCILLAGLCYAFWLSFNQVGSPRIPPSSWPLVWLGFAAALVVNPLPFFFRPSRFWLVKRTGKLLLSGTRRVEFTDFWLGDQFCSLVFSLSNLFLFVCVYVNGLDSDWKKCGSGSRLWVVAFALASLPFVVRLIQSFKRYADSGVMAHLVNAGKYALGIVTYLFYFYWRHTGSGRGISFVLWCFLHISYSVYASTWDLLMDWSLFKTHTRYPLLRPELVYSESVYFYYFAIISNTLLRFTWIMYIPTAGPSSHVRTFVCGLLEIIRRWQWNFYRLENEHLGNVDQYRATREVPLPYTFGGDERGASHRGDDEDD